MIVSKSVLVQSALSFFLLNQISAAVVATGSTVELGGIPYYVPSKPFSSIPGVFDIASLAGGQSTGPSWLPITVLKSSAATIRATELQSSLKTFGDNDDVWTSEFLSSQRPAPVSTYLLIVRQASSSLGGRQAFLTHHSRSQAQRDPVS